MNEFYTFKQLKEKYGWDTTENGINAQIRYAKNRGVIIEKVFKKGPTYFSIVQDNTYSEEEWKVYPRDNKYEVSKNGNVRLTNNHKLVGALATTGYMVVTNQKVGQPTEYYRIHRMVMETFQPIENPEMYVVDHIDGNKQNNQLSNLRWVLQRQNVQFRDENWIEISQNLQKLIEKKGYYWVNQLILQKLQEI